MLRLRVARPCGESFDAMRVDAHAHAHARFCDACEKTVHDLSSRTEAEARALVRDAARRGERVCVRYAKSSDGAVRFRGVGLAAALSLAACTAPVDAPAKQDPATQPAAAPDEDHDMGDAVLDEDDKCPDEPAPNDDGCPEPEKK